ncbi:MAG: hypothetical protein V2A73_01835, partial [Pseudomonadota bacterium]
MSHRCRMLALLGLGAVLAVAPSPPARAAQEPAHPRGSRNGDVVTGLDMAIEGIARAPAGGRLRWFVRTYEIVQGRDLRPAAGTAVRALAPFERSRPVAETVTDSDGRGTLAFAIPANVKESFELTIESRSPRGLTRRFAMTVTVEPRYRIEVWVDRRTYAPGQPIYVWGRVLDVAEHVPAPQRKVVVRREYPNGFVPKCESSVATDRAGVFHTVLESPGFPMDPFTIAVSTEGATPALHSGLAIARASTPALVVHAVPAKSVVSPGSIVQVSVAVRTPDGRPVPRAIVTGPSLPDAHEEDDDSAGEGNSDANSDDDTDANAGDDDDDDDDVGVGDGSADDGRRQVYRTDSHGLARIPWRVGFTSRIVDATASIRAFRAGIGEGTGVARVRIARTPVVVGWAAEGGVLVPGLSNRLFLRIHRADGQPLRAASVRLASARFETAIATTDNDGVAVVDLAVAASTRTPADNPGTTAIPASLQVGSHVEELSLPLDPEATLRARSGAPLVEPGSPLEIRLERSPAIGDVPVVVTLLAQADRERWVPVAQTTVAGQVRQIALTVPSDAVGLLWVRARPLIGPTHDEARGGGTMVWSSSQQAPDLRLLPVAGAAVEIDLQADSRGPYSSFLLALPEDAGRHLVAVLEQSLDNPLARYRLAATGSTSQLRSSALLAGTLAAGTPADNGAAAVLRNGKVVPQAMPPDPVALGRLRDPWHSRARFVFGRLGRIMRAIEKAVAARIPDDLSSVAEPVPGGGWRWNSQLMSLVELDLGPGAVSDLDGSPLTTTALLALAPDLTFDNVARRITRKRLFEILVALRHFVKEKELDYEWALRGDPARWPVELLDREDSEYDAESIARADLFDGWGRPFVVRRAPGGRARFRFLEPIVGYELLSTGPDGRLGTADDLFDPFERVLPSGSTYAEAIGEDALLARLQSVELGRAMVAALGELFEVPDAPDFEASERASASATASAIVGVGVGVGVGVSTQSSWDKLPAPIVEDHGSPLSAVLAARPQATVAVFQPAGESQRRDPPASVPSASIRQQTQLRHYLVVAGAYAANGAASFAATRLDTGAPLLVETTIPERLRPGEKVSLPLRLIALEQSQELSLLVTGEGSVEARAAGATRFVLAAGDVTEVMVNVTATRAGAGRVRLVVTDVASAGGTVLFSAAYPVRTMWHGSLRVQHSGRWIRGGGESQRLVLPANAHPLGSTLVITGGPDLLRDPGFERQRRAHPALFAWAQSFRGDPVPESLSADLTAWRANESSLSALEGACALAAFASAASASDPTAVREDDALSDQCWSGAGDCQAPAVSPQDEEVMRELWNRVKTSIRALPHESARERSAVLVALTSIVSGIPFSDGHNDSDRLRAEVSSIRQKSWLTALSRRSHPAEAARLAAALLLSDRRDAIGRELFGQARAALLAGDHGGLVLSNAGGPAMGNRAAANRAAANRAAANRAANQSAGHQSVDGHASGIRTSDQAVDSWIGTVALAIAAHQLGEDSLVEQLDRGLAPRLYLGLDRDPEATFWLLAASVSGALG